MIVDLTHCRGGKGALSPVHAGRRKVGPLASLTTGTSGIPSGCPWGPCRRRSPSRRPRGASAPGPFGTTGIGGQKDATPSSSIGHRAGCLRKVTGATPVEGGGGSPSERPWPPCRACRASCRESRASTSRASAAGGGRRFVPLADFAFLLRKKLL